jgi:hypothetical protein
MVNKNKYLYILNQVQGRHSIAVTSNEASAITV